MFSHSGLFAKTEAYEAATMSAARCFCGLRFCLDDVSKAVSEGRDLADEAVIFGVVADPEPQNPALNLSAEGTMMKAYSTRPEAPQAFEMKRRVRESSLRSWNFSSAKRWIAGLRLG
jgi:hypothetical protein